MIRETIVTLGLLGALLAPSPARAEISVNVNIGPPPVVVAAPPQLVVVPGSPVYYAPEVSINLFSYRGRYYSFHEGAWFFATTHRGPWTAIAVERVPAPVVAVPVAYYRVPPGHMKKMRAEDHDRGGRGHRGCPPGLAKQGRC